jgi:hypothetical protein
LKKKIIITFLSFLAAGMLTILKGQDFTEDSLTTGFNYPVYQFVISLNAGSAYNPDLNNIVESEAKGLADYYNGIIGSDDFSAGDSSDDFVIGMDAEIRYFINNIGLSIDSGFQMVNAFSEVKGSGWSDEGYYQIDLIVYQFIAAVYYRGDINSNSFFLLGGGAGCYRGTITVEYYDGDSIPNTTGYKEKSDPSSTLGYHLKAEYDYFWDEWFASGGILMRYVQFDKFKINGSTYKYEGKTVEAGISGVTVYLAFGYFI